ncbi:hypothetical protein FRC17_010878 [Serendipita sp. 399]|nr:hypothetical protein FRC17_010878 [Serendipita sp. 399]
MSSLDNNVNEKGMVVSRPAEDAGLTSETTNKITPQMRRRETIVIVAMCYALFLAGWNDGTIGPLLPRIQTVYHLGFTIVSMVFIAGCLGFLLGALANMYWSERYSFGTLMIGSSIAQVIACSVQAAAPPFPVFCLMVALNTFGSSIQDAQANGLIASLHEHSSEKMGLIHALYGLGAFCSPLVATQFAQLRRWSFHYLTCLGFALINTTVLALTLKNLSLDTLLRSIGSPPASDITTPAVELEDRARNGDVEESLEQAPTQHVAAEKGTLARIFGNMTVQLMALFIFIYMGVEVAIGGTFLFYYSLLLRGDSLTRLATHSLSMGLGWTVKFLIDVRGGGPSSGYVSSGFWGGLTVGRIALLWLNKKVGERRVVFLYAILAIGLELVVWFVPSLVGSSIAVSFVGVLLGPMYPICMNHAGRVIPRKVLAGSIGWMAGFGTTGAAAVPFVAGALASRFGIKALQPLLVAMMAAMTVVWAVIPNRSQDRGETTEEEVEKQ